MDNKLNTQSKQQHLHSDDKPFQDFEFDSCSDFSGIGGSLNNGEVSSINVEEYAFQELDLDAQYRSIQAVNPNGFTAFSNQAWNSTAPPQLSKSSHSTPYANNNQLLTKASPTIVVTPTSNVIVPEQPFYIAVTQFQTTFDIDTIVSTIERELLCYSEVSYKFFPERCRWESLYLSGPSRCKFEFNVFTNGVDSHIIEGNRLCGDGFPFSSIFKSVRSKFSPNDLCSSPSSVTNFQYIPLPDTLPELTCDEVADAVAPVLAMAGSRKYESQVNAAQILCDLSLQQNMQEVLCETESICALVNLCRNDFDCCNQHAICALANLSSSRNCQETLLRDGNFLQHLMQLSCDGTFHTAEMRRECARILANVCAVQANAVTMLQVVNCEEMTQWLGSVDAIKDERLRLHAQRAKHALHSAV